MPRAEASLMVDSTSGYEVLAFDLGPKRLVGVAYDPRSTAAPVPWSTECDHCSRLGLQGRLGLPIQVRRLLHALATRRPAGYVPSLRARVYEYTVPSSNSPHHLRVWRTKDVVRAVARRDGKVLEVTKNKDLETVQEGDVKSFADCDVLRRFLRLVTRAVPARPRDALAVLTPPPRTSAHWHASPCNKIPWDEIRRCLARLQARMQQETLRYQSQIRTRQAGV